MLQESIEQIVQKLNAFPWGRAQYFDQDAESLAREHVLQMKTIVEYAGSTYDLSPDEAYAKAQAAGHDVPGYAELMHALFEMNVLRGLSRREHIILAVTAYYFWEEDSKLGSLQNPWRPVLQLYERGYQSTFEENERQNSLELIFFAKDERKIYRIP